METGLVGLLSLLPFTKDATPSMIEAAMRRVKEAAPAAQVKPLAGLLGMFASRFHGTDLALAMIERLFISTEIMQEFPLFREWMAQAEARGEARGEEQGERELLRRILERRFGALSEEMQRAISATNLDMLPDLALAAGTESLEQVRARLGLSGAPG